MARTGRRRKKPGRTRRDGRISRERSTVHASAAEGREAPSARGSPGRALTRLRTAADALLHLRTPDEPVWKYLWPVLALAFAARAAIALHGDFVIHPDEIMQYLEQGHRLAFGNGVLYWEFYYGARSWLIPGLIAGVLVLLDAVGLGEPFWYIGGVKLVFCAISLAIPAGMYFFARRHFDEAAARAALVAGAFWYELAGFAHKPLTEFVATAPSMALLALCARPPPHRPGTAWLAAFLAVLTVAVRLQYAPLVLVLLGVFFLRAGKAARLHTAAAATVFFFAAGLFDAVTWDAGPFHSYRTYLEFNLAIDRHVVEWVWPRYQYLVWLLFLGGGLSALSVAAALFDLRRYGFLLLLLALILVPHSIEEHKEYRYLFVLGPLWLFIGASVAARLAALAGRRAVRPSDGTSGSARARVAGPVGIYATAGALFAAVSLAGALNLLPRWDEALTEKFSVGVRHPVRFLHGQDPVFAAYRWLAAAPGVKAVWNLDHDYLDTPSYYYLHREIPLYDRQAGLANKLHADLETLRASVSHIVTGDPNLAVPGYVVEKEFGRVRILRREENEGPVRGWRSFNPTVTNLFGEGYLPRLYAQAPPPPANFNIRIIEPE